MERAQTLSADATHVPDSTGAQGGVSQPNSDAIAPGEVVAVKDNGIWLGLVIAILIMVLGLLQGIALADAQYTITVSDYCNVREEPSKDSDDLGDLEAGETVTGTDYQSGWVQVAVAFELTQGWVREDLLTLADYSIGQYTNDTGGRVHIRKTPYADQDNHAHWLDAGHTVDVIRWLDVDSVAWAVTKRGYIDGKYLEEEGK